MLVNRFQFVVFVGIIASLIYLAVPDQSDLGQMFFDSYKFERARDYLEHAISKDSNNIKSLKKMAAYHLVQGDNESAVVLYEHLSAIRPRNQKFIERLMLLYDWINKPYKKLKVSERKIELVPESERSALIRSIADGYRYLKKFADADRIFQLLHRLSDDEETLIYLANYYLSTGQIAPAVKVLEQIVRLPAPPTKYRKHLIEIYVFKKVYTKALVQMLLQYGVRNDVKGKIFHADFIKSSQPLTEQRNDRLDRFEQVYIDMKRLDVAIAIRDRRCLLLKKRKKVSCLIELANYYELAGDIRGEIAVLQRRERLVPKDWKRLRRIANKYEELNNIDNAILYFERVRRVVPKNKMNLWKLVGKYNEKSAHESVIARLWMLHDLYERPIKVLRQLADKYEETGKLKLAIKMHLRILELQEKKRVKKKSADAQPPYHRDFFAAMETAIATVSLKGMVIARASQLTAQDRTRIKLIALYEADNDSENAILLYQRLLIDYPRNLKWQIALSRHYLYTDRMDKSARQFAYVLRLDPDNTEALMVLYQYHVGRNAYRDALPFFEKYKRHILVKRENNFTVVDHMNQVEIYRAVSNEEQLTRSCDSVVHNYLSSWEKNKYLIYTILFCLKKQGQHDQRVQIMENFLHKNQKSDDIRSDIVDIKIDAMQLDDARRHLDYMELLGQYKDRNQKQRTYLKEIERDIEEVEKKRVVVDVVAEKGV